MRKHIFRPALSSRPSYAHRRTKGDRADCCGWRLCGAGVQRTCSRENIELINTALKGVAVPDIYGGFLLSDNGKSVQQCPAGYAPIRCSYTERTSRIRAYFKSEHCMGCDHREECQAKQRRATCQMSLSRSAVERARQQQQMHAPDFQNWHRIRNGIESVPSILRNRYQVDKMPVRGFIPSKFFFGAKISAMNFNKLLRHREACCPAPKILSSVKQSEDWIACRPV